MAKNKEARKLAPAPFVALIYFGLAMALWAQPSAARHKLQVRERAVAAKIAATGGRLIADYGAFLLYDAPASLTNFSADKVEPRDDYNAVFLNVRRLDTAQPATPALRKTVGSFAGKRLHLVQFAGPLLPAWRAALLETGARIVSYVPQNAFLVYGDATAIARVQAMAATEAHVQWDGAYLDDYKVHPAVLRQPAAADQFAIQLVADDAANRATLHLIDQLKLAPIVRQNRVLQYLGVVVRIAPTNIAQLAACPDVISIQPHGTPRKVCERQDEIVAGNLSGNSLAGPGYLSWLAGKGFTQSQFDASGFIVDMSDSGIDNGTTSPSHFGLYPEGNTGVRSRVMYNRLEGTPNPGSTLAGCDGHGNLNTHVVCGFDNGSDFPFADSSGYHYGLGACPFVLVGSSVIFDPDNFTNPIYSELTSAAYHDGARISNDSWAGTEDGVYDLDAQEYDALVRDAQPAGSQYATPGNQEMVIVFAAGNDTNAISPPGTAKNVITVGAAQSVQAFGGQDGCGTPDTDADNANAVAFFSASGPTDDGRHKPDLVAPGTHISGGAPQAANPSATGTASACFLADASGVCGGVDSNLFFPAGQQFYTASTGTSHSTPCVSGGCALLRQYFINQSRTPPSPAMTKAYLMNSARYMTGPRAGDNLWSETQGMGEMDLGVAFDGVARDLIDESTNNIFTASGQTRSFTGVVADTAKPFRVTVAWTDAPGNTTGAAYNNIIDLTVTVGGDTYKGNVFKGAFSATGGTADSVDNVQSVFLPAGVSGPYTVTLTAANINSPALPNANDEPNQDFALVIYNAGAAPTLVAGGSTLAAGNCDPASGVINPGETVTVALGIQNAGAAPTTNLVATLLSGNGIAFPSAAQTYGALAPGASQSAPFTFVADAGCGEFMTATLQLRDGAADLGTVSYNFQLGQMFILTNFSENFDEASPPSLPSGWSSSTTAKDLTGWSTESGISDSGANAVYCPDNATVGEALLISPGILITNASSQLSFRQSFNLEDTYDGGVLQISIAGGGFTDILSAGGSFVTGGYIEEITDQGDSGSQASPLKGQQAWSGTSDGFITTIVNLPAAAFEKTIQLRWICGTDYTNSGLVGTGGWWIDSIVIGQGYYDCCHTAQSPVPAILVPTNNFQSLGSSVEVSGTASAGASLTVLVDGTASTTTTADANGIYQTLLTLPLGTDTLAVTENGANTSATVTVVVQPATNVSAPQILLQPLSQEGFLKGTVTFSSFTAGAAPLRYTWLKNGTVISGATASNLTLANLTAKSAADYQLIVANSYGKATSVVAALTLTANPFVAGTFYGLFTETNAQFESSGYLTLTLSSLGKFTGRIFNAGGSYSFSGMFDINGYFSGPVSRSGAQPLALEMNLGLTNGSQRVAGQVSGGSWTAPLLAERAMYSGSNPCPERGEYTLLFGNANSGNISPGGDGYGTVSVGLNGLVSLQGVLSDNTGTAAAPAGLSPSGQWPLYIPLYGQLGSLVGWINFRPTASNSFAGTATWFRTGSAAGFTNLLSVAGSTFTNGASKSPVLGATSFSAVLSGGGLTTALTNAVILENSGRLEPSGTGIPGLALSINPSTGVVAGSFKDPATSRAAAIKGVVWQQQTNAGGFFLSTGAAGNFLLTQP
jgi:hypothetical protein